MIKKNKAVFLFISSSLILYFHELYRLYLGCPRVLGECYADGADRFILIYLASQIFIFMSIIIFIIRVIKKLISFQN